MARQVIDTRLSSREARLKLRPRDKRYWRMLEPGVVALGYRRLANSPGSWAVRRYLGDGKYSVVGIATADDFSDADGELVLSFKQAQDKARERHTGGESAGPYTVNKAMDDYVAYLRSDGRSAAAIKDAEPD